MSSSSNNKWNNLKSSWASSSENKGSRGGLRDRTNGVPKGPLPPSKAITTAASADFGANLAPHSMEDDAPDPYLDEKPQQQQQSSMNYLSSTTSWQSKKQSIVASWRNARFSGSGSGSNISTKSAKTIDEGSEDHSASNSTLDSAETHSIHNYKDLLCLPPKQVSFVFVNANFRTTMPCSHRSPGGVLVGDDEKDSDIGDDLNESQQQQQQQQHRNFDAISSDADCKIGAILGVDLIKNPKTKLFEVSEHAVADSTDKAKPMLSPRQAIMLVAGDVLQSVNRYSCHRIADVKDLYRRIVQEQSQNDTITLTFVCPSPEKVEQQQQHQHHHRQDRHAPMVHQVTLITNRDERVERADGANVKAQAQSSDQIFFLDPDRFVLKTVAKEEPTLGSRILHLDFIPPDNWLEHSGAQTNDVVLSVNTIPCYELYPDDVNTVLQTMVQTHSCVDIKFYSPPRSRRESIKRAAIATAGGALVGTGAIIMATPLHPIGHAMAIGGLGVLGTEFDGPRRALTRVTDAARRMRSSNSSAGTTTITSEQPHPRQHDDKDQER